MSGQRTVAVLGSNSFSGADFIDLKEPRVAKEPVAVG